MALYVYIGSGSSSMEPAMLFFHIFTFPQNRQTKPWPFTFFTSLAVTIGSAGVFSLLQSTISPLDVTTQWSCKLTSTPEVEPNTQFYQLCIWFQKTNSHIQSTQWLSRCLEVTKYAECDIVCQKGFFIPHNYSRHFLCVQTNASLGRLSER